MVEKISPGEIEARSLQIIDSEVPEPRPFLGAQWKIVRRMIHTTADFEMLELARFHPDAVQAGLQALRAGAPIITDTEMARCGIPLRRVSRLECTVNCLINDPAVVARAAETGTTRAAAAVEEAFARGFSGIYVIGNAPTALLRLVELVEAGAAAPQLVVGMPVGFVNALESKEILMEKQSTPYISVEGRKGGSALAASVINALAELVLEEGGLQ